MIILLLRSGPGNNYGFPFTYDKVSANTASSVPKTSKVHSGHRAAVTAANGGSVTHCRLHLLNPECVGIPWEVAPIFFKKKYSGLVCVFSGPPQQLTWCQQFGVQDKSYLKAIVPAVNLAYLGTRAGKSDFLKSISKAAVQGTLNRLYLLLMF